MIILVYYLYIYIGELTWTTWVKYGRANYQNTSDSLRLSCRLVTYKGRMMRVCTVSRQTSGQRQTDTKVWARRARRISDKIPGGEEEVAQGIVFVRLSGLVTDLGPLSRQSCVRDTAVVDDDGDGGGSAHNFCGKATRDADGRHDDQSGPDVDRFVTKTAGLIVTFAVDPREL